MRATPILLILLLTSVGALAQQQERKLIDRIMKPDETLEFDPGKASSFTGRPGVRSKSAKGKEFSFVQKVAPGEFRTRDFSAKTWQGDFKFATKEANTNSRTRIPNVTKQADTKTAAVKEARESEKTMATRELHDGKRPFLVRGRSQDQINAAGSDAQSYRGEYESKWQGNLQQLSVDDVRDLLNKSK